MSITRDIKSQFLYGNVINQLIIVNVAVFLLVHLFRFVLLLSGSSEIGMAVKTAEMISWVSMPLDFNELLYKPWTIITYAFFHYDGWHLFFNMLILYFFGRLFQEFSGTKKVLAIFIYGAILGAVFEMLAVNFIPALSGPGFVMGASAGVMAIMLATATLLPEHPVFVFFLGPFRLKYIALFFIALDIINVTYIDKTAHFAHLGGALFGFVFITQLRKGRDLSKRFNRFTAWVKNLFRRRSKMRVIYTDSGSKMRKTDDKYNSDKSNRQKRVDEILDKINKSGYESLTKEEKDFLYNASKNV